MEDSKTNAGQGLGIAGLVIGIIALLVSIIPCIGLLALIPGVIAITLSALALSQANKANGAKGLIIAALIIAILGTSFAGIWGLFFASAAKNGGYWWKKQIETALNDEDNKQLDEHMKDFGKNLENVLESLESNVDSSSVKIEMGKPMTDAEFDKFLAGYEQLIKETIKLQKETQAGDMKAMATYSRLSVKLAETVTKLAASAANLTEEQQKKLDELNKKYQKEIDSIKSE